jgi:hypothetical protein
MATGVSDHTLDGLLWCGRRVVRQDVPQEGHGERPDGHDQSKEPLRRRTHVMDPAAADRSAATVTPVIGRTPQRARGEVPGPGRRRRR